MLSDINILIILSTIIILLTLMMMLFIYTYFLRQKSRLILRQKEETMKLEKELSLSRMEMKDQTLSYVGQELHDDLAQKLSVALLLSGKLQKELNDSQKENLNDIHLLITECIQDIRTLSKTYISEQIEHFGFVDAIEKEVKRIEKLDFINIDFNFNNNDIDINKKHSVILFRIIQECINNALRHSKAKNIKINVLDSEETLVVNIWDNGIGISAEKKTEGAGITSMINRAGLINTEFIINSQQNSGTEIIIKYPKQ